LSLARSAGSSPSHAGQASGARIAGIRLCSRAHNSFGSVVMIAKLGTHFPSVHTCARARARAQLGEQVDRHARAAKRRIPAHDLAYQPISRVLAGSAERVVPGRSCLT
jgi:hypothetical protein